MNNNAWFIKEKPLLSLQSMGGGASGTLMQGAADKTYVDDVFSTYLYKGTNGANTLNTGLDMSGEGGLLWIKSRTTNADQNLFDTVRGANKKLRSDNADAESNFNFGQTFTSTGFTLNTTGSDVNDHNVFYSSWSFRKAPGFFDVVTWTGNGSNRTIAHSLNSVPGMIIIKNLTDSGEQWAVGHRGIYESSPWNYYMWLDTTNAQMDDSQIFNDTAPTSSVFSIGTQDRVNKNGSNYVAYVFAGGSSTAATARSVSFDGNGEFLQCPNSSDGNPGTGDFTFECWIKPNSWTSMGDFFHVGAGGLMVGPFSTSSMSIRNGYGGGNVKLSTPTEVSMPPLGQWTHIAATRSSSTSRIFFNGIEVASGSDTTDYNGTSSILVGAGGDYFNGSISNARLIKGTALYTSSFKPPTEPLTDVTNTKLLWCNNSSVTGSTVTPGTITVNNTPTANADNPFDDPAGFVFGEEGDQNLVKCGSYKGSASSTGPEIDLGFEPQFLIVKNATSANSWFMFDNMRGIVSGDSDEEFYADTTSAEVTVDRLSLTPTGFKLKDNEAGGLNTSDTHVYMAIRRPDGYVGKPVETATSVFAMDAGAGSSTIPNFDSNFAVDFAVNKNKSASDDWYACNRLMAKKFLQTSNTGTEGTVASFNFDSNVGWNSYSGFNSDFQSWMWKRHAGFDVVTDTGNGQTTKTMAHGLGVVPQMIWRKNRNASDSWQVYHIGLNGGTNPHLYRIYLNTTNGESADSYTWTDAPTSTHFTVGSNGAVNRNNQDFITMLFHSVAGVSKVGYYSGDSTSNRALTFGFQPRVLIWKRTDGNGNWNLWDSTRGFDKRLRPNSADAQATDQDFTPTSTGVTIDDASNANNSGETYIYYAHS